jgi:Tol biopolymer transport system component
VPDFATAADPVWSPDGRHLVLIAVKDPNNIASTYNWYILPSAGGSPIKCPANTRDLVVPFGWWHDRILCERGGRQMGAGVGQIRIDENTFQPVSAMANLTAGVTDEFTPSISRGGLVVFSSETRYTNLYSLPLDVNRGHVVGPLKQESRNLGENSARSVSMDGMRVAFISRRPANGAAQIWVRDLAAGEEHAITYGGESKTGPEINPDGTMVAWRVSSIRETEIFLTQFSGGGAPAKLCSACQGQAVWSTDGAYALVLEPPPARDIAIVKIANRKQSPYLAPPPGFQIRPRAISRDNRWLLFSAGPTNADYHIYAAPFSPSRPPVRSEWIDIASSNDVFPSARWSPDGNLLYFGSLRDGYACLWAQRLDPQTKHPRGPLFAVQHFHKPTEALDSPSLNAPLALSDTGVVLSLTERTSGLWKIDIGGHR